MLLLKITGVASWLVINELRVVTDQDLKPVPFVWRVRQAVSDSTRKQTARKKPTTARMPFTVRAGKDKTKSRMQTTHGQLAFGF